VLCAGHRSPRHGLPGGDQGQGADAPGHAGGGPGLAPALHPRRSHARPGDVVIVEAALRDPDRGADWETPFCAVLTFRDGLIVNDRSYLDLRRWPGISEALADKG
jgi:hypothetical protein